MGNREGKLPYYLVNSLLERQRRRLLTRLLQNNIKKTDEGPGVQNKKPCAEAEFKKILRSKFGKQVDETFFDTSM